MIIILLRTGTSNIYGYKHDQIALQSVRNPVSATRLVDVVLLSKQRQYFKRITPCIVTSSNIREWTVLYLKS